MEKSGRRVRDILSNKYPWPKDVKCSDEKCLVCPNNSGKINCRKQNVGYQIQCTACEGEGVKSIYVGETSKPLHDRCLRHSYEFRTGTSTNALVIHNEMFHAKSKDLHFKFEPVATFRTALDRQLDESLRIANSKRDVLMNLSPVFYCLF